MGEHSGKMSHKPDVHVLLQEEVPQQKYISTSFAALRDFTKAKNSRNKALASQALHPCSLRLSGASSPIRDSFRKLSRFPF